MSQENAVEKTAETVENNTESAETMAEQQPTKEKFEELLNDGRKAFLVQNYSDAAEKLSQAAVLSVELFGDFAKETFTPHYYYGKSLLELSSMERNLIETKFDDEKFADDPIVGEIKEGIMVLAEKIIEAQQEVAQTEEKEEVAQTEEKEEVAQTEEQADETEEPKELDIDQTVGDEEDEEVENAQLAFESLDYARIVCVKNGNDSSEWLERQKDTLVLLGQLALNEDQFSAAIEDMKKALEIMNTHFADDYREIAFINMELARVYRKTNDYASANLHTGDAIKSLEQLKTKLEAEPQNDDRKSLAEIQGLIDEVVDEQNLIRVRECEDKENAVVRESSPLVEKPSETLVIKRKEKRPAQDELDAEEAKKSKVDEVPAES